LGISRRTLYDRRQSASPEAVLRAIAQIVADDNAQVEAEQQGRALDRAAVQIQLRAVW
jgi:hypothetical protein